MKNDSVVRVVGCDLSLNHAALVTLTDGVLTDFRYYTDLASSAAASSRGTRLPSAKTKDRQVRMVQRLAFIHEFLSKHLTTPQKPHYVGLEDYAIRMEQGAHYLGEAGGLARLICWRLGVRLRLHDPTSVKMFTAHNGTAKKPAVEAAVKERWGVDFSALNPPKPKPTPKNPEPRQNRQTSEDLADAYAIAKLVWIEYLLRAGDALTSDLHPKEIQVFNRVTKTYPLNLLSREWIHPEAVNAY